MEERGDFFIKKKGKEREKTKLLKLRARNPINHLYVAPSSLV
jgi:hypothetical protein